MNSSSLISAASKRLIDKADRRSYAQGQHIIKNLVFCGCVCGNSEQASDNRMDATKAVLLGVQMHFCPTEAFTKEERRHV
jgi:hypothetical protein